jgi:hypothetical protein
MAGKYQPLTEWLMRQQRRTVEVSFGEIERVLGFPLPPSSRTYVAHWHGLAGSRVATAIYEAGWQARLVDLRAERLTLEPVQPQRAPRVRPIMPADVPAPGDALAPPRAGLVRELRDDAVHEGAVVDAVVRYLGRSGWAIRAVADAARRERGDDIRAERDGRTLVVEAKGYPSRKYADARRAAEHKPTHPSLQAKHWLSNALLTVLHTLGRRPDVLVAIALPDILRYRNLVDEMEPPLRRLGVGVLFVGSDGEVVERLPLDDADAFLERQRKRET